MFRTCGVYSFGKVEWSSWVDDGYVVVVVVLALGIGSPVVSFAELGGGGVLRGKVGRLGMKD